MVALSGIVVTKEQAQIEVSLSELIRTVKEEISYFDIVVLAKESWLKSRALGYDVKICKMGDEYHWEEYENNGSHYSGYFDSKVKYQEGDKEKLEAFNKLLEQLR